MTKKKFDEAGFSIFMFGLFMMAEIISWFIGESKEVVLGLYICGLLFLIIHKLITIQNDLGLK